MQVRTRLMNQPADARIYKGFADCFMKVSDSSSSDSSSSSSILW